MRKFDAPLDLAELYAEMNQAEIARRFGVDRTVVRRWLREAGVPVKSESAIHRDRMAAKSYEERLRITSTSRARIKGRSRSDDWHRKRALGVQRAGKMSYYERLVFAYVSQFLGYEPIPQYAVWKFNIDIALPEHKFGIEVDGGLWHTRHSPRKAAQDKAKSDYLGPLGWQLVRVRARDRNTLNRQMMVLADILRPYARVFTSVT